MYVKVGTDGLIYVRKNLAYWTKIQNQRGVYASATMLRNGTILAIGLKDGLLRVLATPVSEAEVIAEVPGGRAQAVTTLLDGSILLLDADGNLWHGVTPRSGWVKVSGGAPPLFDITTLPGGGLLGLEKGGALWLRENLSADWVQQKTTADAGLARIEALADGSVAGVDDKGHLLTLADLNAGWTVVPDSDPVFDVAALAGTTLLGISPDDYTFMTADGYPASWVPLASQPKAGTVAVAVLPADVLVALDTDGQLSWARLTGPETVDSWTAVPPSITAAVETSTAPSEADDPNAPGRLDEVTFLLERCIAFRK